MRITENTAVESVNTFKCERFGDDNWIANPMHWPLDDGSVGDWEWSHLIPSESFRWSYGRTPFSNLFTIAFFWIAFAFTILGLKYAISKKFINPPSKKSLNVATFVHNVILSVASLYMFVLSIIALATRFNSAGLHGVLCMESCDDKRGVWAYTLYAYYISKFYELVDTVILVLRQKNLTFLHLWHHTLVSFMAWIWIESGVAAAMVGVLLNTGIHVATSPSTDIQTSVIFKINDVLRSIFTSKIIRRNITRTQIIQFMLSFLCMAYHAYAVYNGSRCTGNRAAVFSFLFNSTLLYLFARFYFESYSKKKAGDEKSVKSE